MDALITKWDAFYTQKSALATAPVSVLADNAWLLPKHGTALDLACGLGANALFLAEQGLSVSAWDISQVALSQLDAKARQKGWAIDTQMRLIDSHCLENYRFDVIVVSRFLDRTLTNAIIAALNVGGLLFYQTYTQVKAVPGGPNNTAFLLAPLELLQLFAPLTLVYYRDNALLGDRQSGLRNEAQFIGQKKSSA